MRVTVLSIDNSPNDSRSDAPFDLEIMRHQLAGNGSLFFPSGRNGKLRNKNQSDVPPFSFFSLFHLDISFRHEKSITASGSGVDDGTPGGEPGSLSNIFIAKERLRLFSSVTTTWQHCASVPFNK